MSGAKAPYSQDAPDFVSENEEILKGVECVREKTEGRGIWMMDRGGDRGELMIPFLDRQMRFIIRLKGDRNVIYHGHPIIASQLSSSTKMLYAERVVREESGAEKPQTVEFGFRRVRFPGRKEQWRHGATGARHGLRGATVDALDQSRRKTNPEIAVFHRRGLYSPLAD
jgi:hypothetical protein